MLTFVIINSVYAIKGMSGNKEQTEDLGFLSCMYSLEGRKKKGFLSNIAWGDIFLSRIYISNKEGLRKKYLLDWCFP